MCILWCSCGTRPTCWQALFGCAFCSTGQKVECGHMPSWCSCGANMGLGGGYSFGAPVALYVGWLRQGWGPSAKASRVVGATRVGLQLVARLRADHSWWLVGGCFRKSTSRRDFKTAGDWGMWHQVQKMFSASPTPPLLRFLTDGCSHVHMWADAFCEAGCFEGGFGGPVGWAAHVC